MKILLVEDNNDLALNITEYFESKGYIIDYAADGLTAFNLVSADEYDIILLDITLPGMDGYTFCGKLRNELEDETPVIMLTARDLEDDKLKGFSLGTDDYMVKPFSLPELEARLLAINRRSRNSIIKEKKLVVGDLVYDTATMVIQRNHTVLKLKPVPRKILILLMQNSHRVVTRHEIEQEIWNDDPPDSEVLRAHIYAIRRELDKNYAVKLLHTIHGTGYRIVDSSE